jgi:hypothetical protein
LALDLSELPFEDFEDFEERAFCRRLEAAVLSNIAPSPLLPPPWVASMSATWVASMSSTSERGSTALTNCP